MLISINALDDAKTRLDKEKHPENYPKEINYSGSVTIFNRSNFKVKFLVTFRLNGKRHRCYSDIINKEKSQQMILPRFAENVKVNILDCLSDGSIASIIVKKIDPKSHSLYLTYGFQGFPKWKEL